MSGGILREGGTQMITTNGLTKLLFDRRSRHNNYQPFCSRTTKYINHAKYIYPEIYKTVNYIYLFFETFVLKVRTP